MAEITGHHYQAINKAIDNGANIISMSWTVYPTMGANDPGLTKMTEALKRAENKNIIMFCASQDSEYVGHRDPYPATNCNSKALKRIGSAGIYGERSEYVKPKDIDYLFPGEIAMSPDKVCSGSSAATALAAGLAGLILWCCALLQRREGVEESDGKAKHKNVNKETERNFTDKSIQETSKAAAQITEDLNFQTHERMYGLFDELTGGNKENPLVNVTGILFNSALNSDPAKSLVESCKHEVRRFFKEKRASASAYGQ